MKAFPVASLLALSLAACSQGPQDPEAAAAKAAEASVPAAGAAAGTDHAPPTPMDPRNDSPARLDGIGAVALGASIDEVRSRFGEPLQGLGTDAAGKPLAADDGSEDCYYLRPQKESPEDPWLMIEGRKLVRYDVRGPAIVAPGGGKVGMTLGELQKLYPERGDVTPDKYDPQARHLRVRPGQEGQAIIDFALGADGKVGSWRVGMPPQVDYVEGCG